MFSGQQVRTICWEYSGVIGRLGVCFEYYRGVVWKVGVHRYWYIFENGEVRKYAIYSAGGAMSGSVKNSLEARSIKLGQGE
jgi:hypothetical protein